jgi:hypothetical protein
MTTIRFSLQPVLDGRIRNSRLADVCQHMLKLAEGLRYVELFADDTCGIRFAGKYSVITWVPRSTADFTAFNKLREYLEQGPEAANTNVPVAFLEDVEDDEIFEQKRRTKKKPPDSGKIAH